MEPKSLNRLVKRFAFDTLLAVSVFVPLVALWNRFVVGIEDWQVIGATVAGTFVVNLASGGLYGKLLDLWRRKLAY